MIQGKLIQAKNDPDSVKMIQAKIADIGMRIELSRLMMYKAAALYDAGVFVVQSYSMTNFA